MEVTKKKQLAAIENNKFKNMIDAIGQDTSNIARAGPEMQAKLLSGLGIKSMMITDGKSPIDCFSHANDYTASSSSNNNVMGMMHIRNNNNNNLLIMLMNKYENEQTK